MYVEIRRFNKVQSYDPGPWPSLGLVVVIRRFLFVLPTLPVASCKLPFMPSYCMLRYQTAQNLLFGEGVDIANRFSVTDDERGQILLQKIFDTYQDCRESHNSELTNDSKVNCELRISNQK